MIAPTTFEPRIATQDWLLDMAQARWRRLDGAHLLPLVRAGIAFVDGKRHATTGCRSSTRAA
jgi:hypothetical protein